MWNVVMQAIRAAKAREQPLRLRLRASRGRTLELVREDRETGELELALPGLYGRHGALPDYFTDELLLEGEDREAMRAFLDIFNQRLLALSYQIWSRYKVFSEDPLLAGTEQGQSEARMLERLGGRLAERDEPLHLRALHWHKLALYRRRARSGDGLLDLLRTFFPDIPIRRTSYTPRYRDIPSDQFAILGQRPLSLGADGNFLTGSRIKDIGGAFTLHFGDLTHDAFLKLSPGGEWRKLLAELVQDYTQGQLECLLELELRAEEVPQAQLGQQQLGRNLWARANPAVDNQTVDTGVLA